MSTRTTSGPLDIRYNHQVEKSTIANLEQCAIYTGTKCYVENVWNTSSGFSMRKSFRTNQTLMRKLLLFLSIDNFAKFDAVSYT